MEQKLEIARNEGMVAFEQCEPVNANPYPVLSEEWEAWRDGYDFAYLSDIM